jgi:hypothetical protein
MVRRRAGGDGSRRGRGRSREAEVAIDREGVERVGREKGVVEDREERERERERER